MRGIPARASDDSCLETFGATRLVGFLPVRARDLPGKLILDPAGGYASDRPAAVGDLTIFGTEVFGMAEFALVACATKFTQQERLGHALLMP